MNEVNKNRKIYAANQKFFVDFFIKTWYNAHRFKRKEKKMEKINYAGDKEIVISYGEGTVASLSTSFLKYCNKAKKLAEDYPGQVEIYTNKDGSVYITFPPEWIKFPSPKKIMTEENKIKAAERMKKAREKKNEKD